MVPSAMGYQKIEPLKRQGGLFMRRRNKMSKRILSVVLAAAMVLTGGAFQTSIVKAEEASTSASATCMISDIKWGLYKGLQGAYIVRNEDAGISYFLQNDGTAWVSQADSGITECEIPASIPFTYTQYENYLNALDTAAVTPSPDDYFNDSNKSTVTTIMNTALKGCALLETVTIAEGVSKIGKDAFALCSALKSIYVPYSVQSMGYDTDETGGGAVEGDILDSGSTCTIYCIQGSYADTYATGKGYNVSYIDPVAKTVTIAEKKWIVYSDYTVVDEQGVKYQLNGNDMTAKVTGYDKSLAASAVSSCTIPKSVPLTYSVCGDILKNANPDLSSLTGTGTSVAEIADGAFKGTDLEKIVIEADGIQKIGEGAFAGCTALIAVQIPNTVGNIGNDILDQGTNCTVYCWKGSTIDTYAQNAGYKIQYMDDAEQPSVSPSAPATATPAATATPVPEQTATPAATQRPSNTWTPPVIIRPVTPAPVVTQTPSVTASPSATVTPDTSASPAVTAEPDNTETPSATDAPVQTGAPSVTEAPTEAPGQQQVVEKANVTYHINGNSALVTNMGDGKAGNITIPSTVMVAGVAYPVKAIGKNAFAGNKKIKTISIGNNVKTIGEGAFNGCTNLKKVKFPKKITKIGKNSFKGCKNLKSVSISSNSLKMIDKGAFKGCRKLKKVTLGTKAKQGAMTVNGQKVRYGAASVKLNISASAFENCVSLKQMVINSLVKRIGNSALKNCKSLRSLIVNSKILQEVAKKALKGVSNCRISVPGIKLKPYSVLFKNKGQGKKVIVAKI